MTTISQKIRSYFFSGVAGSTGRLFNTGNRPNKQAFSDLCDSILFKLEPGDSASETDAGHSKIATDANLFNRVFSESSFVKTVVPDQLPVVDIAQDSHDCDEADVENGEPGYAPTTLTRDGIQLILVRRAGAYKKYRAFIVKHLADLNTFQYNSSTKALEIKSGGITNSHLAGDIEIEKVEALGKGTFLVGTNTDNSKLKLNADGQFIIANTDEIKGVKNVVMSGDATMDKNGVITIGANKISLSKLSVLNPGCIITGSNISPTNVSLDLSASGAFAIGNGAGLAAKFITGVIVIDKNGISAFEDTVLRARVLHSSFVGKGLETTGTGDSMSLQLQLTGSLVFSSNAVQLDGDAVSPGNNYYYGTGDTGTKGWIANILNKVTTNISSNSNMSDKGYTFSRGIHGKAYLYGSDAKGNFQSVVGSAGSAQETDAQLYGVTTDATETELFLNVDSARVRIPTDCVMSVETTCVAVQTAGTLGTVGDTYSYKTVTTMANKAGTVSEIGTPIDIYDDGDAAFGGTVAVTPDDTNKSVCVKVTGEADKTIKWYVIVKITMLGFRNFAV
jgi:hypothetical protein